MKHVAVLLTVIVCFLGVLETSLYFQVSALGVLFMCFGVGAILGYLTGRVGYEI
jgi:hypothetical protein